MDFNNNHFFTNHLAAIKRLDASAAADVIDEFNAKRLTRVLKARSWRPLFFGVRFVLQPGASVRPYTEETRSFDYPVDVVAAIADLPVNVGLQIRTSRNERAWVSTGSDPVHHASPSDLAGDKAQGPFYYTAPYELPPDTRLVASVLKNYEDTSTIEPHAHWLVFVAARTFTGGADEARVSSEQVARVKQLISQRRSPEQRFLTMPVIFDAAGRGNDRARSVETQSSVSDEPLLIRGFRTNLERSLISISIEGEDTWTPRPVPIYGLASTPGNAKDRYVYLPRPLYLPPNKPLVAAVANNSGNGGDSGDGFDQNDLITILTESV